MHRLVAFAFLVASLAAALPADAAEASVFLEEMTWTEVRDAVAAGRTTAIVPVGGTEQSGPHMALGKHNVRVHVLAGRIAERLGNALVAPVVAYVPEGDVAGRAGTSASPARSRSPGGMPRRARRGGAQPQAARLSRHRADRRPRRLPGRPRRGRGAAEPRMGGDAPSASTSSPSTTSAQTDAVRRGPAPARPERGADRHPRRQRRHLADARRRPAPGACRQARPAAGEAAEGTYGDPRAATAALGQHRRRPDRRCQRQRDPQGRRSIIDRCLPSTST